MTAQVAFFDIESSSAFVLASEGNGCAERFIRMLKENLLLGGECQASCRMACVMMFVYAAPLFRVLDRLWTKAAWTTASRSGLSVTAAIGVQLRV